MWQSEFILFFPIFEFFKLITFSFQFPVHTHGRSLSVLDPLPDPGQQAGRDNGQGCRCHQESIGEGDVRAILFHPRSYHSNKFSAYPQEPGPIDKDAPT